MAVRLTGFWWHCQDYSDSLTAVESKQTLNSLALGCMRPTRQGASGERHRG